MNNVLKIYCFISLIVGTVIYICQKQHIIFPKIVNNYVNDFLIVPICLTISLALLRITRNNENYYLKLPLVLYLAGFYSILFEVILPAFKSRYTSDFIDVLLYFISSIVFYTFQTKQPKSV